MAVVVRLARGSDVAKVKALADEHRHELGFVKLAALEKAIQERRLLVTVVPSSLVSCPPSRVPRIVGFVHFRCCKDGHATIYEIAVHPSFRQQGIGKALVHAVIAEAKKQGCSLLRLKCPVDLPANGFYARCGFVRVAVENGKRRHLAIWERTLDGGTRDGGQGEQGNLPKWQFFIGLTGDASQLRALMRRFFDGYRQSSAIPPFNPFERILVSPLFTPNATLRLLKEWRWNGTPPISHPSLIPSPPATVFFDSGGYQVQMGKLSYDELCRRLRQVYEWENWADLFVLPDHVPTSKDSDAEVERKIKETLTMGELFLNWLSSAPRPSPPVPRPSSLVPFIERVIGVVHGRTVKQIREGVRKWHELGVRYIAFGSFGTSGRDESVNLLSQNSLKLLKALQDEALSLGMKFHIFGIGNPTYLVRLKNEGIEPTSFDSTGWWKAGGFGNLLFVGAPQLHFARYSASMGMVSTSKAKDVKAAVQHDCPFCSNLRALRDSRWLRVLHNLVAFAEAVQIVMDGAQNPDLLLKTLRR
jgi:ribosomal protein S18 acetylase RimI-like enzyme